MSRPRITSVTRISDGARQPPVRIKLRRLNADIGKPFPPDGHGRAWWERLKTALGTTSSAFVNASLTQLQLAARGPGGGPSETAVNGAIALVEAVAPQDEVEGALAIQMACTHAASMAVLARLGGAHGSERRVTAMASAAARLLRAYTTQVEMLRRLRGGKEQHVRVEHVHIGEGGRGIVGIVNPTPGR